MRSRLWPIAALTGLITALALAPIVTAGGSAGAVYTITNAAAGNAVVALTRGADGSLQSLGTYPTGGLGSGGGLGSQGAVVLSANGRWLLTVDAGSDEISAFAVQGDGSLVFADRVSSGGDHPISVTINGPWVYAVNDGGAGGIAGFQLDSSGDLTPIAGSSRPLSSAASGPAQISFAPDGRSLLVTEKATNRLTTYAVGANGVAGAPTWIASAGETPFGFEFDKRGRAIVSEAFGGAADASTVSSYAIEGGATLIDGPVATTETAACWVVVTQNGRFAYASNTGSGSISGFAIGHDGSLTLLDADGVTGSTGGAPTDMSLSRNSKFLYARTGGTLNAFAVASDGSLAALGSTAVGAGIVGLASR